MKSFQSKVKVIPGTSYQEVVKIVRQEHKKIEKQTKRIPYVRSTYFNKDKVFISLFMAHITQKNLKERTKRLKLYNAGIDLLRNSRCEPETLFDNDDRSMMLHRFYGITKDGIEFCVQVKHNKRSNRKDFMSVFDIKTP